jgi:hypothetical protein
MTVYPAGSAAPVAKPSADHAILAAVTIALAQCDILRLAKPTSDGIAVCAASIAPVNRQRDATAFEIRHHRHLPVQ